MPDYKQGKIYKIIPKHYNESNYKIYYGATTQRLLSKVKADYRVKYMAYHSENDKGERINNSFLIVYEMYKLFDNFFASHPMSEIKRNEFNENNLEIVLVENFPCNNNMELKARLRTIIDNNDCINKTFSRKDYVNNEIPNANFEINYKKKNETIDIFF